MNVSGPAHSILEAGGWVLLTIFAVSGWAWVVLASKWIETRRPAWRDRGTTRRALELLRAGATEEARRLVADARNVGDRAVRLALRESRNGSVAAERLVRAESTALRRQLDFIAMLGATLPLLGLFGTVLGMLETFAVLASGSRGGVEAGSLAHGVSRALVTTQAGLVTAIPVVLGHRWLSLRIERIVASAESLLREAIAGSRALPERLTGSADA